MMLLHRHVQGYEPSAHVRLAGGFGGSNSAAGAGEGLEGTMKETSADDLAVQLVYAEKVIFVPGFGLAQAQAQRELADLGTLLKDHGVEVSYAIHPVAGRMPGHMNVLLAEANVPSGARDLDDINPQFPQANVALVVGADDVTNPAARKPGTPVSGMPILDVDKAQNVVVMKRGPWHRLCRHPERAASKTTRRCCLVTPRRVCRPSSQRSRNSSTDGPARRLREDQALPLFGGRAFCYCASCPQTGMGVWIGGNCPLIHFFQRIVTERWTDMRQ